MGKAMLFASFNRHFFVVKHNFCNFANDMKQTRLLMLLSIVLCLTASGYAQKEKVKPYFELDQLPRLIDIMPAPPAFDSPEFANDVVRYGWGKQQREDSVRVATAIADAEWFDHVKLYGQWKEAFGLEISEGNTPEIWKLMETSLATTDPMRRETKAYYHRQRPFERFNDSMPSHEEDNLRGEGSYPSGHSLRGWTISLLLAQIAPQRADAIYRRGWDYCNSRVIVGAHWQSDVDASRAAASIGFCALQGSKEFVRQMKRAQEEYAKKTADSSNSKPATVNPTDRNRFVTLAEAVPDAILEIRYYSTYNFTGSRINGYEQPTAMLTKEAAKALRAASDELRAKGYRLKIYDAYRPQKAVDHFVRWADDLPDTLMKSYFYPDLDKSVLFDQGYIASKSGHTRGSTVDLTLFDMATEKELDMGGTFDWFGPESHPDFCGNPETGEYTGDNSKSPASRSITAEQFDNRMTLRRAMLTNGFKPIDTEWWHFTLEDEPYPDTYFTFPVRQ